MKLVRLICTAWVLAASTASAREVVEAKLPRSTEGASAAIRGLVDAAPQPKGRALLVFPGWPGIPRIEVQDGRPTFLYLQQHVQDMRHILHAAGISIVTVDCPTDQWGARGFTPTACDDRYRSSEQHAQDVSALIDRIRETQGFKSFYVMGHSYGAVSSHWLAIRLGEALSGSIHSATQSVPGGGAFTQYAYSVADIKPSQLPKTSIYLHHRDDLCRFTPYDFAQKQAVNGLMTVVGGNRWAEPCGKASFHSYAGRSTQVGQALVKWMNEGIITAVIKGADD
jgi:hypothetical protein